MASGALAEFKQKQVDGWAHFGPTEVHTTRPAAKLIALAAIEPGQRVLDVGTGTGPAAITAARAGSEVTGLDPTSPLLRRGEENAAIADVEIRWQEGDVEEMPFPDGTFDAVISAWGHMFAPRAQRAADEMLRVLRPGGTIAFMTWAPDGAFGDIFRVIGGAVPPPPEDVDPPLEWGDRKIVESRLGDRVRDLVFEDYDAMITCLSPQHYRTFMEATVGPVMGAVTAIGDDMARLTRFRQDLDDALANHFVNKENAYVAKALLTRAVKA